MAIMQHRSRDTPAVTLLMALMMLTLTALLGTDQLLFMVTGVAGFLIFYILQNKGMGKPHKAKSLQFARGPAGDAWRRSSPKAKHSPKELRLPTPGLRRTHPEARFANTVAALPCPGSSLDAEVPELLARICPTAADDAAVGRIVRAVAQAISPIFPEAEVLGYASAKLTGSGAFGVAVPEVDLVIAVNPVALLRRLRLQRTVGDAFLDEHRFQKHVLRKCSGRLVDRSGFKFRRSAFGGPDPKVTLLLPSSAGFFDEPIPLDISVNSAGPLRASALLAECGAIDPRARELILLVRRWAKDRGVSHAARGNLSPYAWSVLVVYFLQVGVTGGSILPPFRIFKAGGAPCSPKRRGSVKESDVTVSQLFIAFFRFYAVKFDLQREAVSAREGLRRPHEGQARDVPVVEDPFEPGRNLAEGIESGALERMNEELARAHTMCSANCDLTALIESWLPPEAVVSGTHSVTMGSDGHVSNDIAAFM